jgi:predicted GIY-YIG superfamily endonuclease
MSRRLVYTLHFWPPLRHAKHYTGSTPRSRLAERLFEHATGTGARITQVQVERGGYWVLAQTEPGGYFRERQLKQHGATRRCQVCKAISGYQAGRLDAAEALTRAGWGRATQYQRTLLLDMFRLPAPPAELSPAASRAPQPEPRPFVPAPRPEPVTAIDPEIDALVDALIASWSPKAKPTQPTPATPSPRSHPWDRVAQLLPQARAPAPSPAGAPIRNPNQK